MWFDYHMVNDWIMRVDTNTTTEIFRSAWDAGRWWYDHRCDPYVKRVLQEGVFALDTLFDLWIKHGFDDRRVEHEVMERWCSLSGSFALPAPPAGSNTPSTATKRARRIATGYSRHRLKPMVVPVVMSGGVRK